MGLILWIHVPGTQIPQPTHFVFMSPNSTNSPPKPHPMVSRWYLNIKAYNRIHVWV